MPQMSSTLGRAFSCLQLASLCCQVALHRCENGYGLVSSGQGPSARDLMQPIFALVAAELAWR